MRGREGLPLDAWTLGAALRADGGQFKANAARNKADTGAGKQVTQRVLSAGLTGTRANDRKGSGVTLGQMQKF